jgi:hypothetical protein
VNHESGPDTASGGKSTKNIGERQLSGQSNFWQQSPRRCKRNERITKMGLEDFIPFVAFSREPCILNFCKEILFEAAAQDAVATICEQKRRCGRRNCNLLAGICVFSSTDANVAVQMGRRRQ